MVTCALGLLLTACSSPPGGAVVNMTEPSPVDHNRSVTDGIAGTEPISPDDLRAESIVRWLFDPPTPGVRLEYGIRFTDLVRGCMSSAGFVYSVPEPAALPPDPRRTMSDREFRLTYGYGIATTLIDGEVSAALAAQLAAERPTGDVARSNEEQLAYDVALYGPADPSYDPAGDNTFVPAELNAGCVGEATLNLASILPVPADGLPAEVARALSEIETGIVQAPSVQPAVSAWAACMTAAGYDVANRTEAMEVVHQFFGGTFEVNGEVTIDATTGDGRVIPVVIPAFDAAQIEAGSQLELRVARADQACDDEHGMSETIATERHRRRVEFVERYEALLIELPGGRTVSSQTAPIG